MPHSLPARGTEDQLNEESRLDGGDAQCTLVATSVSDRFCTPSNRNLEKIVEPTEASEDFRTEVRKAAMALAADYHTMFKEELAASPGVHAEEKVVAARQRKLVFELNRTGKYLELKETLRSIIVRVVKEKYRKSGEMGYDEMRDLYNDLYVHLIDEMHHALNDLIKGPKKKLEPPVPDDSRLAELQALADEYEINGDIKRATQLHAVCSRLFSLSVLVRASFRNEASFGSRVLPGVFTNMHIHMYRLIFICWLFGRSASLPASDQTCGTAMGASLHAPAMSRRPLRHSKRLSPLIRSTVKDFWPWRRHFGRSVPLGLSCMSSNGLLRAVRECTRDAGKEKKPG